MTGSAVTVTPLINPTDDARPFQLLAGVCVGGVVVGLAMLIGQILIDHFRDPVRFPIESVTVEGVFRFTEQQMLQELVVEEAKEGFFNVDIDSLQRKIAALPWIDQAYVRRIWPGSISVTIEEHQPVARFNSDSLISASFDLFKPSALSASTSSRLLDEVQSLIVLRSPGRRHVAMLKLLNEIEPILASQEIPLIELHEDNRRSLSLILEGGVEVIVGHEDIHQRVRRFADVFSGSIAPIYDDVLRVDMRHTNGFALAQRRGQSTNSGNN